MGGGLLAVEKEVAQTYVIVVGRQERHTQQTHRTTHHPKGEPLHLILYVDFSLNQAYRRLYMQFVHVKNTM